RIAKSCPASRSSSSTPSAPTPRRRSHTRLSSASSSGPGGGRNGLRWSTTTKSLAAPCIFRNGMVMIPRLRLETRSLRWLARASLRSILPIRLARRSLARTRGRGCPVLGFPNAALPPAGWRRQHQVDAVVLGGGRHLDPALRARGFERGLPVAAVVQVAPRPHPPAAGAQLQLVA